MKNLTTKDLELFSEICKQKDKTLLKILYSFLKTKYKKVYFKEEQYVYAVGAAPVALVAHCDTVFPTPMADLFYDREKNVIWSPDGNIGDDRAGVYAIIKIIYSINNSDKLPSIIFTNGEEMGGVGATELQKDFPKSKSKLNYIIELDRNGFNDCVFYDCDNPYFEDYVENFGFKTSVGSFSDISIIAPSWGVAAVNLSIGYVEEHSYAEHLYVDTLLRTIKIVKNMVLKSFDTIKWDYIPRVYKSNYFYNYDLQTDEELCDFCGTPHSIYNLLLVDGKNVCIDCASDLNVEWCAVCGTPHFITEEEKNKGGYICEKCRG